MRYKAYITEILQFYNARVNSHITCTDAVRGIPLPLDGQIEKGRQNEQPPSNTEVY